jgi:hypothetical protein
MFTSSQPNVSIKSPIEACLTSRSDRIALAFPIFNENSTGNVLFDFPLWPSRIVAYSVAGADQHGESSRSERNSVGTLEEDVNG